MIRLCTTLAVCLAAMVMVSDRADAADYRSPASPEVKTAFFQPRPGGVVDVITSPFRALTTPVSYRTAQQSYRPYYGQAGSGVNCVNGRCYTTNTGYGSSCVNGYCPTGSCATGNCATGACTTGNCGTGYYNSNCPGGNCGVGGYQTLPFQTYTGYRGTVPTSTSQYSTYRPVSQPVYRSTVPARSNSIRNDPFFP